MIFGSETSARRLLHHFPLRMAEQTGFALAVGHQEQRPAMGLGTIANRYLNIHKRAFARITLRQRHRDW